MSYPTETVWFESILMLDPHRVYHRRLNFSKRREVGGRVTATVVTVACGMVERRWNYLTHEECVKEGMLMRRDLADRIGRPCRKCWPET